jgi:CxxC motif-containing protein (DUF1111 family)
MHRHCEKRPPRHHLADARGCGRTTRLLSVLAGAMVTLTALMGASPERSVRAVDDVPSWAFVALPGGEATVLSFNELAFTRTMPSLSRDERQLAAYGASIFNREWTATGPLDHGGLGPRYIENSCAACHPRNGRGGVPYGDALDRPGAIMFVAPGGSSDRVLTRIIDRGDKVVRAPVTWTSAIRTLADGETVELRRPAVTLTGAVTLRTAPAVFGLGLLEAIPEERIAEAAATRRFASAGIRGRPHWLAATQGSGPRLGRFGWKAELPSIGDIVSDALGKDMGIVSPRHAADAQPEISQLAFDALILYMQTLGVPARSPGDRALIGQGARRFEDALCTGCHTPRWTTGTRHPTEALRSQSIASFSDLLLHDMGDGLAASHASPGVDRREWRTSPLWGLGLTKRVTGREEYLHDGRARSLTEAILWHDGEAERSRRIFERMTLRERRELLAFLDSL